MFPPVMNETKSPARVAVARVTARPTMVAMGACASVLKLVGPLLIAGTVPVRVTMMARTLVAPSAQPYATSAPPSGAEV